MAIEWYEEKPDGRVIENLVDWRQAVDVLDNPIHRAFYKLLLFTGLRKGEAMTLEWNNIYGDRIHLPMTKNGRSFDLPILPLHHEILAPMRGLSWVAMMMPSASSRCRSDSRLRDGTWRGSSTHPPIRYDDVRMTTATTSGRFFGRLDRSR